MHLISRRSAWNFLWLNTFLLMSGTLYYAGITAADTEAVLPTVLALTTCKDYMFLYATKWSLYGSPSIGNRDEPKESYRGEFHYHIFRTILIESSMIYYISRREGSVNQLQDLALFIPVSFVFELIFDFFHYTTHYAMHRVPILYQWSHKVHHKFRYPTPLTTYYQHPTDIILTNTLPVLATLKVMSMAGIPVSFYTFCLLNMYKTYIEISGHCGKVLNTTSFPQCVWIPRWLGIGLRVQDHDLHHTLNNCNYAKRFTLWDKVFGSYRRVIDPP